LAQKVKSCEPGNARVEMRLPASEPALSESKLSYSLLVCWNQPFIKGDLTCFKIAFLEIAVGTQRSSDFPDERDPRQRAWRQHGSDPCLCQ
jgi:hypothetical protein